MPLIAVCTLCSASDSRVLQGGTDPVEINAMDVLFKQQLRQNSPEGQEPLDFVTCQSLGRENIWKPLKDFSFRQSLTITFCCSSSGGVELAFTSFSGKECDTCPENEEFFPVKCPDHHRRNVGKHHPFSGVLLHLPQAEQGKTNKLKIIVLDSSLRLFSLFVL